MKTSCNSAEFNRGTHRMERDDDDVWRCRRCRTDVRFIGLDYCLNLERSYTTRTVRFGAPDMVAEVERARHGFPWCSTCHRPSIAGGMGWSYSHVSDEYPSGAVRGLDPYGDHEVSHREWFAVPS